MCQCGIQDVISSDYTPIGWTCVGKGPLVASGPAPGRGGLVLVAAALSSASDLCEAEDWSTRGTILSSGVRAGMCGRPDRRTGILGAIG